MNARPSTVSSPQASLVLTQEGVRSLEYDPKKETCSGELSRSGSKTKTRTSRWLRKGKEYFKREFREWEKANDPLTSVQDDLEPKPRHNWNGNLLRRSRLYRDDGAIRREMNGFEYKCT